MNDQNDPRIPAGLRDDVRDFLGGGGVMAELVSSMDWAKTPLGPLETWPQSLRTTVSLCLASNFPISIAWGPQRTQIYNDGYWPICGAKHPHSMGQDFKECWFSAWPAIGEAFESASAGKAAFLTNERMFLDRYGFLEETFFTFSFSPIRDESGGVGGLFHPVTEMTQQTLAERRLKALRELADQAAEAKTVAAGCDVIIETLGRHDLDLPFALLYILDSDAEEATLAGVAGLAPETAASPQTVLLPASREPGWPYAEAVRERQPLQVDDLESNFGPLTCGPYPEAPRTALVLPINLSGLENPFGLLIAGVSSRRPLDDAYRTFYLLLRDAVANVLTNARAHEEERTRLKALAEIDHAKTVFYSNVSHEFRTPLTLMLGPLEEAMRRPALAEDDRRELEVVHRNGLRLLKLVNSLLEFSRIEAGRAQASFEPTDLAGLTVELVSTFRSATEKAGLGLAVDCPPLPEPVYVDRDMWEKIVLNLVSNAFKFTFEGEIRVALKPGSRDAMLTVRDTGIGIPEHEVPRLFERFHRVEGARGRSFEGSGIGLALVQELAHLHGAEISVDSEEGHGTSVTVSIPFGTAHLPQDHIRHERTIASTAVQARAYAEEAMRWLSDSHVSDPDAATDHPWPVDEMSVDGAVERSSILLADDNADMRDYVCRLLGARHDIEAVADGLAAWNALRERRPDLLITDIMMPRLDGLGLLAKIREDEDLRDLLVIVLSARAGEEASIEGLSAGADAYLVKPFSARELVARVDAALAVSHMRRQMSHMLRESEARFRNMADNAPVMIWTTDPTGYCTYLSRSWYEFTGQTPGTGLGFGWLDATHPDDRQESEEMLLAGNAKHESLTMEYRLRRHDGKFRWAIDTATPWFSNDGEFLGYIGSVIDIDERKKSEEHRRLLVDELNHRVKNTLAIVQGIAQQTFKGEEVPVGAVEAFEGRLTALASAHNLLTRTHWRNASLAEVAEEAAHCCDPGNDRLTIGGPPVILTPKQAVTFAMALHELCVNAMKYGALSSASGVVSLEWSVPCASDPRLELIWREIGGPPVSRPYRRGFGSRMIEQALAQELAGDVVMDFRPEGLVCKIDAPLPTDGPGLR